MRHKTATFVVAVLTILWLAPQAQAQYRRHPRPWRAIDFIQMSNYQIDAMAARECSQPYPPRHCFGNSYYEYNYYGYDGYGPDRYRSYGRRDGLGRALDIAERVAVPLLAYKYGEGRGRREGVERGYEIASREGREREYEHRRQRQETHREERREELFPMTNTTHYTAIVSDGNAVVTKVGPNQTKKLPEPRDGYEAELRIVGGNTVENWSAHIRENDSRSGWEIVQTVPKH